MNINVALDGPSAAGKTTIASAIASRYKLIHLDTGSMYRCVAYYAKMYNLDVNDEDKMVVAVKNSDIVFEKQSIFLNHIDVTSAIRNDDISMDASTLSKHAKVRELLVRKQQEIASSKGYVLDGRDIGTVVLPDADVKIFLTADVEIRAKRRYDEYINKDIDIKHEEVLEDLKKRDYQDINRDNSPLIRADDAIEVNTTNHSLSEAINIIFDLINEKIGDIIE